MSISSEFPAIFDGAAAEAERIDNYGKMDAIIVTDGEGVWRRRFNPGDEIGHRAIGPFRRMPGPILNQSCIGFVPLSLRSWTICGRRAEGGGGRKGMTSHELMRLNWLFGTMVVSKLMRLRDVRVLQPQAVAIAFRIFTSRWRPEELVPRSVDLGLGTFEKRECFDQPAYRALGDHLVPTIATSKMFRRRLETPEFERRSAYHAAVCRMDHRAICSFRSLTGTAQ